MTWKPPEDLALSGSALDVWGETSRFPVGIRALSAMDVACRPFTPATEPEIASDSDEREKRSRDRAPIRFWPSTLTLLDETTGGGFYGVSTVAAGPKVGKTMLAIASAIEAAATQNWNVLYVNAELDDDELMDRVDRYMFGNPGTEDANGYLNILCPGVPFSREAIVELLSSEAHPELPILTVMDSINSLALNIPGNYLDSLRHLSLWIKESRRISRGAASFLAISEMNARGGVKGAQMDYWSDLILQMEVEKGTPDMVDIMLLHSRRTKGNVKLDLHFRDARRMRFYSTAPTSYEKPREPEPREMRPVEPFSEFEQ